MSDHPSRYNRDEEQKPGRPPRSASEPKGAERSTQTDKTLTDPSSGESRRGGHPPNQSQSEETDGGGQTGR